MNENPALSARQLDAFVALAEHRSFTRAAVQCHLSQPAFSALIKALEDELGARLFDRSTRHVDLTPEGVNFLESRNPAPVEHAAPRVRLPAAQVQVRHRRRDRGPRRDRLA